MVEEFKEFIKRGNLVEIAVAFVLGASFATVVSALTTRIVSPLIGLVFDLSGLDSVGTFGKIDPDTGMAVGSIGAFLEALLNFVIVGLVMFLVVKAYNRLRRASTEPVEEPAAPPTDPEDIVLLRRIAGALDRG